MAGREKRDAAWEIREHLRAHGTPSFQLSAPARGRILAEARETRREAGARSLALHRFPAVSLTAAAVAFLILSAGFLAGRPGQVSGVLNHPEVRDGVMTEAPDSEIWVDYRDGQVILTRMGETHRPLVVRHGSRIQEARRAEAVRVEGPTYVESVVPAPNEAVFYVVE